MLETRIQPDESDAWKELRRIMRKVHHQVRALPWADGGTEQEEGVTDDGTKVIIRRHARGERDALVFLSPSLCNRLGFTWVRLNRSFDHPGHWTAIFYLWKQEIGRREYKINDRDLIIWRD